MLQDNPAATDAATEAEITPIPGYKAWCPPCYAAGIDRLIKGFTIEHYDPTFPARVVPPLSPSEARAMAAHRDRIITQRAEWPSDAADHARHAGGR
jgi:hypothetical protein